MAKSNPPAFSYAALLASDPELAAALANVQIQGARNQNALTAARQAALIQFGMPDQFQEGIVGKVAPDINGSTRKLAQESSDSGLSTLARLARSYHTTQEGDLGSLYGRGALRSGDFHRVGRENLQDYQVATSDATTSLLGQLAGLSNTFTGQQEGLAQKGTSAVNNAAAGLTSQITSGLIAAPPTQTKPTHPAGATVASITTPVTVGGSTGAEPKPSAANYASGYRTPTQPKRRSPSGLATGHRPLL